MIYICIPAYNEAATIGVVLWKIRQVMTEFPRDYEILVLDDGSTDETQEVLGPYERVLPLAVLKNEEREGYAAAVDRLLREASKRATHPRRDVAVTMQADFTEGPEDIPALIKRIEGGADIVEGAVTHESGTVPRAMRWSRKGLPLLLGADHMPEGIRDPISGFRAYRIAVIRKALEDRNGTPLLTGDGWAANVELLFVLAPHSRRTEGTDISRRHDRRQRESRVRTWSALVSLWTTARRARSTPLTTRNPEKTG
ncbi:MAG TPA: glycosyltransferase family 2 protein [Longimicrobiaceae bacterium]|nr:glycosyltransferase family 2 protein [Longimicrobiaceae bacterium]